MVPVNKDEIRIEPPNWWVGMADPFVQLLVYGAKITKYKVEVKHQGIKLLKVSKAENPNYLFIDLLITSLAEPGNIEIIFYSNDISFTYSYELFERDKKEDSNKGFDQSDVVYLIMPDRFANGNPAFDNVGGMLDKVDRRKTSARHGGDLKGIRKNLEYLVNLGVTALWLNPVFENNMPDYSYHGYAITDFYNVDSRLGNNFEYKELVDECHTKGLKVIMDMVFNHCGSHHWFYKDLPMQDWVHQFSNFTRTNYRNSVICDPYSSEYDENLQNNGWFDTTMPDLNQKNRFVANYLIQNSIWWCEFSGIDGIRMDTYPYPDKEVMSEWVKRVKDEYPKLNIVGEAWLDHESMTAFWQKDSVLPNEYNSYLPSVTDFPLYSAIINALNNKESWDTGLIELYNVLAQDFLYPDASLNLIFADNHDVDRIYTSLNHNFNKFKMAMVFLLTTRGVPQIYYGTEILMDGEGSSCHGNLRQDFPGGWPDDLVNAFTGKNLSADRLSAMTFMKKLLKWRKTNKTIHYGALKHFIPENGDYVFFRYDEENTIMVILHKSNSSKVSTWRYNEFLSEFSSATDILSGEIFNNLDSIWMEGFSARILELKK